MYVPCMAERLCTRALVVGTDKIFNLSFMSAKPYTCTEVREKKRKRDTERGHDRMR